MEKAEQHGVIGVSRLDPAERMAVEALLACCKQQEGIDLPLGLEPHAADLDQPSAESLDQFLAYEHGALVGFARLEGWEEPELCAVVHPDHRRKGVGQALLSSAHSECRRRGEQTLVLVCDQAIASGPAFAAGVGAIFRFAEYRMVLDPAAIDRSQPRLAELRLQPATAADTETLVRIQAVAFGDSESAVRQHVTQGLSMANRQYYIGMLGAEPAGSMRIGRYREEADVTAFGVLPMYQGRGYGRQMLRDAIEILVAEAWPQIVIDVVTENRNALKLYQSCGFRETTTYGFYYLGV
jgi:ribosomal protein S18 acetylase RimI-like enzyme